MILLVNSNTMKYIYLSLSFLFLFSCENRIEQAYTQELLWTLDSGLVHPESIIWDEEQACYFVSNIGNNESDSTPDGFISKLNENGEIITLKFTNNIQSPKGLCIANKRLYVSALDELLEIDVHNGAILNRYTNADVQFLNDVTHDDTGNVYVSGMRENAIYKLSTSGVFETWFKSDSLEHPNGVFWNKETLFIGGWGNMDAQNDIKDTISYLFSLNPSTKILTKVSPNRIGKVDGIQETNQGVMISSWKAGEIFTLEPNAKLIIKTETSVGDICFLKDKNLLLLPLNFQHKILAYKIKDENK